MPTAKPGACVSGVGARQEGERLSMTWPDDTEVPLVQLAISVSCSRSAMAITVASTMSSGRST